MATDIKQEKPMTLDELEQLAILQATEVEWDSLVRDGVLERVGKNKYRILDWGRLPDAAQDQFGNVVEWSSSDPRPIVSVRPIKKAKLKKAGTTSGR